MTMETIVSRAIWSTSQPLQTGFSPELDGDGGSKTGGGSGAESSGSGNCSSPLRACGSNCGFSDDAKRSFLYALRFPFPAKYPASAWPVYDFFTLAT